MPNDKKSDIEMAPVGVVSSQPTEKDKANTTTIEAGEIDAIWGLLDASTPSYRSLGWIRASVLLIKVQIGLGVLSIPSVLHTLGLIPGIFVIVAVGLATTYTDYIVGTFRRNHPEVYSLADVGMIIWGPIGREILGAAYWIDLTAVAGAGLVGVSTALNALSSHAVCTVVFVVVAAIINILISSIQTLSRISWIGWIGLFGILSSVIVLAAAVGVQDRPAAAPPSGPWDRGFQLVGDPSFAEALAAVSNVIFSYAGAPNFFNVIAEMKRPQDYPKALAICQSLTSTMYLVIGCVVYRFCGAYVSSPALGSAGVLMKKVCYGLALPGLIVGCVLNTHMPAKYIFVRLMRNSRHLTSNTITHRAVWIACVVGNCTISFIIAESIPVFGDLIGLIGAVLATPIALTVETLMWYHDNKNRLDKRSWSYQSFFAVNTVIFTLSLFCIGGGAYANGLAIHRDSTSGSANGVFSCADNSGST